MVSKKEIMQKFPRQQQLQEGEEEVDVGRKGGGLHLPGEPVNSPMWKQDGVFRRTHDHHALHQSFGNAPVLVAS